MDTPEAYKALIQKSFVNKGLDHHYVDSLMVGVVQKYFPEVTRIDKVRHDIYKRRVGKKHSTFIYGYYITGSTKTGVKITKYLIYSSHTDESRLLAYNNMKLLDNNGFNRGNFIAIRPLAYLPETKALIYEGIEGKNLLQYMKQGTRPPMLENLMSRAAGWLKKFHTFKLPEHDRARFSTFDSKNMNPALENLIAEVERTWPERVALLEKFFETFLSLEDSLKTTYTPGLVYGDYHPENIITDDLTTGTLTMIDFTDLAIGDQLRDIGSFVQQLHFMALEFYGVPELEAMRVSFVEKYFGKKITELSDTEFQRINLYQAWNSARGFVWFLFITGFHEDSFNLLEDAWRYLMLVQQKKRTIRFSTEQ